MELICDESPFPLFRESAVLETKVVLGIGNEYKQEVCRWTSSARWLRVDRSGVRAKHGRQFYVVQRAFVNQVT
jgi:hypothetical protein